MEEREPDDEQSGTDFSSDDDFADKTYSPPKKVAKLSKKKKQPKKKKDIEFEDKKKVAIAVGAYKNLYDVSDPGYMDKQLEKTCWKKVAETTGLDFNTCVSHWQSLKRSARYHAQPKSIPSKSGASSSELKKKYRDEWQFAEAMSFYTPPSLKKQESLVSIVNTTSNKEREESVSMDDSMEDSNDTMLTETTNVESVYVS